MLNKIIQTSSLKGSLLKALVGLVLYLLVYQFHHIEFIKTKFEDFTFDLLNKTMLSSSSVHMEKVPNIIIFGLDDLYMEEHDLIDNSGHSTYGYLFPRDKLAEMLYEFDNLEEKPRYVFIDYELSYYGSVYAKEPTLEDTALLEALKSPHDYTIILPKTKKYHFTESSPDTQIQKLLSEKKIILASVDFAVSKDHSARRFFPSSRLPHALTNVVTEYPHSTMILFEAYTKRSYQFINDDVIGNRIILKSNKPSQIDGIYQNHWENIYHYSASYTVDAIPAEKLKDAIVFIGDTKSKSKDTFNISSVTNTTKLFGIDLHAQTLMTHFYLDGQLNYMNIYVSLFIIFIVIFFMEYYLSFPHFASYKLAGLLNLVIASLVFYMISYYMLIYYKVWFNWFVPIILGQLVKNFSFIKNDIYYKILGKGKEK